MATILRMPQVIEMTGVSRAHVYALISRDEFPRPIRIGKRAVGWIETDVEAWITARPLAGSWTKTCTRPHHPRENRIAERDVQE
jgi:prophage regulatory protein